MNLLSRIWRRRPVRQRGVALLELVVATALAALLAAWAAARWLEQAEQVRTEAMGRWLDELGEAMAAMMRTEFAGLSDPSEALRHPYVDRLAPSVAELKRFGYLSQAFPTDAGWAAGAGVRLWREGACPGPACLLQGLAYLPLQATQVPRDLSRRASLLASLRGFGGLVWPQHPDVLRGASFVLSNPLPDGTRLPTGTVAVHRVLDAGRLDTFVRLGDSRDPSLSGSLSVAGPVRFGDGVRSEGRLDAREYLRLGGTGVAGQACPEAGLIARVESGAGLLLCTNGLWQPLGDSRFGGLFFISTRFGCRGYGALSGANPLTGQCSCPPGFRAHLVGAQVADDDYVSHIQAYLCQR